MASGRRRRREDTRSRAPAALVEADPVMEHHIFVWEGGGRQVYLMGSFNNWTKIPLETPYGCFSSGNGVSVDLQLPAGRHQYIFEVDGVKKTDPANSLALSANGYNQVIINSMTDKEATSPSMLDDRVYQGTSTSDKNGSSSLFLKYPYQASRFILDHLKSFGYSECIRRHQWKTQNTAIIVVSPASIADEIISKVNKTKVHGRHEVVVEHYRPRHEKKQPRVEKTSITASGHCKLFIGSGLPGYTNEQHILDHFEKFSGCITNVEVVRDRVTKRCKGYGYVTFLTVENAQEAKLALHRSKLLGVIVNVNFRTSRSQLPPDDLVVYEDEQLPPSGKAVATVIIHTYPKLPLTLSNGEFRNHFRDFKSDITNAFIANDKWHRQYKEGTGIVEFSSIKAAEYAVEKMMNTKIVSKYEINHLYVDYEKDAPSSTESDDSPDYSYPKFESRKHLSKEKQHPPDSHKIKPPKSTHDEVNSRVGNGISEAASIQESPASQRCCVVVENLDPMFTESQIRSMIEVPMVSCRRLADPPDSVLIKCYTQADALSVVEKLHQKKYLKRTISVQLVPDHFPEGNFTSTSDHLVSPTASGVYSAAAAVDYITEPKPQSETVFEVIELDPHEWNTLMQINTETGILKFSEIKEPFKNNPNIIISADHDQQCLSLTGKQGAVQDGLDFLMKHLKGEIKIDNRHKMEALYYLKPDLPSQVSQTCGVIVREFRPDSTALKLEGKSSNIKQAHGVITMVIQNLTYEAVKLDHDCGPEDVARYNNDFSESSDTQVYVTQDSHSPSTLIVWSLYAAAIQKAKPALFINVFSFDCAAEEAYYLKTFKQDFIHRLPAKVDMEDGIVLKGTKEEVEQSSLQIHERVLHGLYSRKFSYSCKLKLKDHIEETVLMPHCESDSSFQYHIRQLEKLSHINAEAKVDIEVYIYSKVPEMFGKISSVLDCVSPSTKEYANSKNAVTTIVMVEKTKLENKYNVILMQSSKRSCFVIDGLIPADVQACYDEIQDLVEINLDTTKSITINKELFKLLKLYQGKLAEIKRNCGIVFDSKTCTITLKGTIRQVNEAQEKLSDLLNMNIFSETVTLSCQSSLYKIMVKRWKQVQQEQEKNTKTYLNFTPQSNNGDTDTTTIKFEIIGSDVDCVQDTKQVILSEGTETEEKVVTLTAAGMDCFQKVKKDDLFKNSIVAIQKIDKTSNQVTLVAPKELSESLDLAETTIHKIVGEKAKASFLVPSNDPVVSLILLHPQRGMEVAVQANHVAQHYKVNITVQKKPAGLRLAGTEAAIENAKPLVQTVIDNIEKLVGKAELYVDPICLPFLSSSEFGRFETTLGSDLCVTCSYPRSGQTSKSICCTQLSTVTPGLAIKVEISKGDLVFEQVDAIVNAANEDLKHIGGLAKAIVDAGGQKIQEECDEYIATHKKLSTGSAICSGPGELPCKKIIHAVGPRWRGGKYNEEQYLYYSVLESLKVASLESLTSIGFPAIGTGVFGVPVHVSARMSLKAVRDFFQSVQSTITHVKFVLLDATVSDFVSQIESGICGVPQLSSHPSLVGSSRYNLQRFTQAAQPSPLSHSTKSSTSAAWEWKNDQGKFMPYTPPICRELELAYKSNPSLPITVQINGNSYTIDFQAMEQINDDTGATRTIRNHSTTLHGVNVNGSSGSNVQWEYRDRHQYIPYTPQQSVKIERMYQDGVSGTLIINNTVYNIDPVQMCQTNSLTKYPRKMRRHVVTRSHATLQEKDEEEEEEDKDEEEEEEEEEAIFHETVITLRGPHDNLQRAKMSLQKKLKGSLSIHCFDKLPQGSNRDLEKKLSQIAKKHTLKWSFADSKSISGKSQRIMNLTGVSNKIKAAVEAIQEEVLSFHLSSEGAITYPSEWVPQTNTTEVFQVKQRTSEWRHVCDLFGNSMGGQQVVRIERIQNKWLWEKYHTHKKRLDQKNNGQVNEKELFHGTRANDPRNIYEGEQGFDMRFSSKGMWGSANYFAVNASYSDNYSYQSTLGRQMFLVKVLTGESYNCPKGDGSLKMPPEKPVRPQRGGVQFAQMRYDTVTGVTHGCQVFMTYDNDKAYPAYLITYQ